MNLTATSQEECTSCGIRTALFLHNVRHRTVYRRLCTSCVLRLHPASFCPSCFQLHDPAPPHLHKRITCSKCNSITHAQCVPTVTNHGPTTPYHCPPCADLNFVFFDVDRIPHGMPRAVDRKRAVVLRCAAKIASVSMHKAVVVARTEAERKVREAAVAGKRAKEALEHVAMLRKKKEEEESAAGTGMEMMMVEVKEEYGGSNQGNGSAGVVKVENVENGKGSGGVLGGGFGGVEGKTGN